MNTEPAQLVSLKVIAARIGVGVKRLHQLMGRVADENPLPVQYDRVRGWLIDETAITEWEAREEKARLSYQETIATTAPAGPIRVRKAS